MTAALEGLGYPTGRRRVIAAMRSLGLGGVRHRPERGQEHRYNERRTRRDRSTVRQCHPDRIRRAFDAKAANAVWVADITELRVHERAHLAFVIDLASRRVLAAAIGDAPDAHLASRMIDTALASRGPSRGLIVHTDRGGAFASHQFQASLRRHGAASSMSRRHNPWDNAVAESFIATLKCELLHGLAPNRRADMKRILEEYIDWYNHLRLHSYLGYLSPAEFEWRQFGLL